MEEIDEFPERTKLINAKRNIRHMTKRKNPQLRRSHRMETIRQERELSLEQNMVKEKY